eukprot:1161697-Pelagomonas_calceolata.AAC.10
MFTGKEKATHGFSHLATLPHFTHLKQGVADPAATHPPLTDSSTFEHFRLIPRFTGCPPPSAPRPPLTGVLPPSNTSTTSPTSQAAAHRPQLILRPVLAPGEAASASCSWACQAPGAHARLVKQHVRAGGCSSRGRVQTLLLGAATQSVSASL